jgi:hypothetical protein
MDELTRQDQGDSKSGARKRFAASYAVAFQRPDHSTEPLVAAGQRSEAIQNRIVLVHPWPWPRAHEDCCLRYASASVFRQAAWEICVRNRVSLKMAPIVGSDPIMGTMPSASVGKVKVPSRRRV